MTAASVIELETCQSTQDEVRARLIDAAAGSVVAVRAAAQLGGRGREGRTWQDPPGGALLLSVGVQGPVSADVLVGLPRRIVDALLDAIAAIAPPSAQARAHWKSPNDIVDDEGAKLAGVLVDARTTGGTVDHVVVGVGVNLGGPAFVTGDGRHATTLEALGLPVADARRFTEDVVDRIASELRVSSG